MRFGCGGLVDSSFGCGSRTYNACVLVVAV